MERTGFTQRGRTLVRRGLAILLLTGILMIGIALPALAAAVPTQTYATQEGTYFHSDATCSGMRNAILKSTAEWQLSGKGACPVCIYANADPGRLGDASLGLPALLGLAVLSACGLAIARKKRRTAC